MRLVMTAASALALTACAVPNPMGMGVNAAMSNSVASSQRQGADLMAAQAQAQAQAARPGDDQMSCEAIQAEMAAMFNDPKFTATVASMGAEAQNQQARAKGAAAAQSGLMAGSMAAGVAGSFLPGGGWLAQGAAQAQMAAAMAQIPAADRSRGIMLADMQAIMPQMMRGQRLNDLAAARKCAFLTQAAPAKPN